MNDTNIDDGGPAFPWEDTNNTKGLPGPSGGMSLRDWFAGQALAGIASLKDERVWRSDSGEDVEVWRDRIFSEDASYSYRLADAMIAARKVKP